MTRINRLGAAVAAAALLLVGCSSGSNPLSTPQATGSAPSSAAVTTVKVGSANFAESEIVAELYAQALEAKGVTVQRTMKIGARDAYLQALKDGSIDLVPEYTGNLLLAFDKTSTAKTAAEVTKALADKTPTGMTVLTASAAEDKDSYNVTKDFSAKYGITSLADLSKFTGTLRIGGMPELADRAYGPKGLSSVYGVDAAKMTLVPLSDGGGPLTVKALKDGSVDVADLYTTTPDIAANGFVTLADPQSLILPQNVVPLASTRIATPAVTAVLDAVSAKLTTADLMAMNGRNSGAEKASAKDVAAAWLKDKGLA